jgi:hypothetical protein
MSYNIIKMNDQSFESEDVWRQVTSISIDNYPWDENGYKPKTLVKMFYTETGINIKFISEDMNLKAVYEKQNDTVCKDSCVEFFFNPNPESDERYINFEANAIGTFRIGIGSSRQDRKLTQVDSSIFKMRTTVNKENLSNYKGSSWTVEYFIPFNFIELHYGKINYKKGHIMKGNFYKCGDETKYPHFGCWNPIKTLYPDFHRSEYFGNIIFI